MSYTCMGGKILSRKAGEKPEVTPCTNTSETPSVPEHPEWGYLCSECANSKPNGKPPQPEPVNVGAMQVDPEEYRDLIGSGFIHGARHVDYDLEENDGE